MGLGLLQACYVIQNGSEDGHHLGFYSKLEIIKKNSGNCKCLIFRFNFSTEKGESQNFLFKHDSTTCL